MANKTCVICGKSFSAAPASKVKTCSSECRGRLISRKLKVFAANHRSEHYLTKTCPICGKVFETILNRNRTYCSRKCASKRELPKNSEICVVCGRKFYAPKSMGFKTCSEQCRSFLRSQNGKRQDLTAMHEGLKKCPKMISSPQHFRAREWSLRSPNGTVYKFRNLNYFVRTNREMFASEFLVERRGTPLAAAYLSHLAPWRQPKRKRVLSVWGWTWAE